MHTNHTDARAGERPAPERGSRAASRWARLALLALAGLAVAVLGVVVKSNGSLLALVGTAALYVVLALAASWWAVTTRNAWKRGLNLLVVAALVVQLLTSVVVFSAWHPLGLLTIVGAALAYAFTARRALTMPRPVDATDLSEVPPPARPWLLVNPWSGGGTAGRVGLLDAAERAGIEVHVLAAGDDAQLLARDAVGRGAGVLGAAGGDGSLGPIAAIAMELDVPFVCIPAGTRNHFAYDLGLDRADALGALTAFEGVERRIDAARVGDRVFLNNVSMGAYADVVSEPGYRARKLNTARVVVRRLVRGERAPLEVTFHDPSGSEYSGVEVLHVSNNGYDLRGASRLGARDRLDGGSLQVTVVHAHKGVALARVLLRAAFGRGAGDAAWAQWDTTALRVESPRRLVPAGLDGEAVELAAPLEFEVLPRALRVLVPPVSHPGDVRALSWDTITRLWATAARPS